VNLECVVRPGAMLAIALSTAGCLAPVVQRSDYADPVDGAFRKVAVIPFHPWPAAAQAGRGVGGPPPEAPPIVAAFFAAALAERGIEVISPEDFAAALGLEVEPLQRMDPAFLARFARDRFGATSILVGRVLRYRDRTAVGTRPSVAFEVTAHLTPMGVPLTTLRFDETQSGISERPSNLFRLPGGGTRWLTPVELSQWGAESSAESLVSGPPVLEAEGKAEEQEGEAE
jgi:hypothetical protein